jgi:hypothetical protein
VLKVCGRLKGLIPCKGLILPQSRESAEVRAQSYSSDAHRPCSAKAITAVSGFLLIFFAVLLEVLSVRVVGKDDTKRILKIEAENDFVGRLAGAGIFTKVKYPNNRIKKLCPYLVGIAGVEHT